MWLELMTFRVCWAIDTETKSSSLLLAYIFDTRTRKGNKRSMVIYAFAILLSTPAREIIVIIYNGIIQSNVIIIGSFLVFFVVVKNLFVGVFPLKTKKKWERSNTVNTRHFELAKRRSSFNIERKDLILEK